MGIIEAPSLTRSGDSWILYFSSGCFTTPNYTVSYATADSITGPYTRAKSPLFTTGDYNLTGPGGMSVFKDGKHMVFHGWHGNERTLYSAEVSTLDDQSPPINEQSTAGEKVTSSLFAMDALVGLLHTILH